MVRLLIMVLKWYLNGINNTKMSKILKNNNIFMFLKINVNNYEIFFFNIIFL